MKLLRFFFVVCGNIFNLLLAINAACNFILYCVLSDRYRRTFKALFFQRNMNRNDTLYNITRSRITQRLAAHRNFKNGLKRNTSAYNTPRNLEVTIYLFNRGKWVNTYKVRVRL